MTITSLTFTLVNSYAPQAAKTATAVERKTAPAQTDDAGCEHQRPASRQSRFADAMMSALRELGFGSTPAPAASTPASAAAATPAKGTATAAASATTTAASATTTTATATGAASEAAATTKDASATVESAVQQFAHALFQALRQGGNSGQKADDGGDRVEGHGHHHHHRHHGEGQGYGNLSQRLESLSQTLGAPAAPASPAGAAAPSQTLSLTLTVDDGAAAAAPAVAAAAPAAATATPAVATPAAAPAKNALLDAFTKLFNTLKPASADAPATDMAAKLRQFLHSLAQSLAPDTTGSVQRAQVGGMLDVSA